MSTEKRDRFSTGSRKGRQVKYRKLKKEKIHNKYTGRKC